MKRRGKQPTQRTMDYCRANGWIPGVVERFIKMPGHPGGGQRKDLFGCIDVICIKIGACTVGIQTTARSGHSERLISALVSEELKAWLSIESNKFEIWSWAKKEVPTAKGKKVVRWFVRIEQVYLRDGELDTFGPTDPDMTKTPIEDA